MHGLPTTTKRMQQCFALRVMAVAVGVGKIPVHLESGERMRSRPELTT